MQGIAKESADHMFWAGLAPKYQTRKKPRGIERVGYLAIRKWANH